MIRRLQLLVIAAILLVAAFSTELEFLFYLVYLVDPRHRRLVRPDPARPDRSRGRLRRQPAARPRRRPAPGDVHAPQHESPAQAVAGGPQPHDAAGRPARPGDLARIAGERSWLVRAPLTRRGHFRIEPLQIRTGDPFGFFEASASVGQGVAVVVYPRVEPLPLWRLPAASIEGQPRCARADAPDDPARDDRPALGAGRQLQPNPLEVDGAPRRDPGQGVRAGADRRRVDLPRPRAVASRAGGARSRPSRWRSGRRPRSRTRRSSRTAPWE